MICALHRRTTRNWPNDAWSLPASVPSLPWLKHLGRLQWIIWRAQPGCEMRTNHLDKDVIGQVSPSGLPCRGALEDELIAGWDKKKPRPRPGLKVDERSPPPQARWPDSSEPTPVPKALPTPIWGGRPSCGEWTGSLWIAEDFGCCASG